MKNKMVKLFIAVIATATLATGFSVNTEAATKVALNKKTVTLTQGRSTTLKVKGISSKTKVKYSSNKKSIATVSSKGKITAKKKGIAIVSAKFTIRSNKKKITKVLKCKVTVKAKVGKKATPTPAKVVKVTVKPTATPTVAPTVTPTVTPEVVQATSTPTPEPTVEVSPETPVATVTVAPTATPTVKPTSTVEPTEIPECKIPIWYVDHYNSKYGCVDYSEPFSVEEATDLGLVDGVDGAHFYPKGIHSEQRYTLEEIKPTYDTQGYQKKYCSVCGEVFSEEIIPNNCYTARRTTNGWESVNIPDPHNLSVYCGENVIVSPDTPSHAHNFTARYEVVRESTCTEDGLIRMYCECGEVYERVICASHHNISYKAGLTDAILPTETTEGCFDLHCNDCNTDVTFSERTTFPALTDENYPLDGWVYEKHDYDYDSLYYMTTHKVDRRHADPYIVVSDYIGTAEHPALKDSYVIDGVKYDVEIQGKLSITSPTVQSLRISGCTWVNPDRSVLIEKKIVSYKLGGMALYD